MTESSNLESRLSRLRLGHLADVLEPQNAESLKQKHSYLEFLDAPVDEEFGSRDREGLQRRVKAVTHPILKTLEHFDFDFHFQPNLDIKLVNTLLRSPGSRSRTKGGSHSMTGHSRGSDRSSIVQTTSLIRSARPEDE